MVGNKSLRENSTRILERDKALGRTIEICKDVSLSLILKDKGGNQDCLPFTIKLEVQISSKKEMLTEKEEGVLEATSSPAHIFAIKIA